MDTKDILKKLEDIEKRLEYDEPIYAQIPVSEALSFPLNYQDRRLLYAWSPVPLSLLAGDLGTLDIPGTAWVQIAWRPNTTVTIVGLTTAQMLLLCATNQPIIPTALATARQTVTLNTNNPTATGSATDVTVSWGDGTQPVTEVILANNTSVNVNYELNAATTAGSDVLAPGQKLILTGIHITSVHLQAASSQNINGTSAANIVVRGYA